MPRQLCIGQRVASGIGFFIPCSLRQDLNCILPFLFVSLLSPLSMPFFLLHMSYAMSACPRAFGDFPASAL